MVDFFIYFTYNASFNSGTRQYFFMPLYNKGGSAAKLNETSCLILETKKAGKSLRIKNKNIT